jgi:hypothetical protein
MTEPGVPYDFVYVHTDIPEGMTIREWRGRSKPERLTRAAAARADRQQGRVWGTGRWLARLRVPVRRLRVRSREAHG